MSGNENITGDTSLYRLGWFMDNPTYINDRSEWSFVDTNAVLRIDWNKETGLTSTQVPAMSLSNEDDARRLSLRMETLAAALAVHKLLAQREQNHPTKFGLVPHTLPLSYSGMASIPSARRLNAATVNSKYQDFLPYWSEGARLGWFAPNANTEEFGTLFLYAGEVVESTRWNAPRTIRWCLGQVGLTETVAASAMWNDDTEVAALCENILAGKDSTYLTMAVLTEDGEKITNQRHAQEARKASIEARTAFSKTSDRIKPRLVKTALQQAETSMGVEWRRSLEQHNYSPYGNITVYSLNGYGLRDIAPSHRGTPAPINIGARLSFFFRHLNNQGVATQPEPLPSDFFDPCIRRISNSLRARNLGHLLRVTKKDDVSFYVVANVSLALQYAAALNITDEHTVHQYDPANDRWITPAS